MAKLIFKAEDVLRIVKHSLAAPEQSPFCVDYTDAGEPVTKPVEAPAVILVHDQGVYLLSNGNPRDIVSGTRSFAAYAKGCDPEKDEDWYETARDLVGGDDFGETLPWAIQIAQSLQQGATHITISMTASSIKLGAIMPRKRKAA